MGEGVVGAGETALLLQIFSKNRDWPDFLRHYPA